MKNAAIRSSARSAKKYAAIRISARSAEKRLYKYRRQVSDKARNGTSIGAIGGEELGANSDNGMDAAFGAGSCWKTGAHSDSRIGEHNDMGSSSHSRLGVDAESTGTVTGSISFGDSSGGMGSVTIGHSSSATGRVSIGDLSSITSSALMCWTPRDAGYWVSKLLSRRFLVEERSRLRTCHFPLRRGNRQHLFWHRYQQRSDCRIEVGIWCQYERRNC